MFSATLFAQVSTTIVVPDSYLELLRSDVRAKRRTIIAKTVSFTDEQGKKFWPLYGLYEAEQGRIDDARVGVIRDFHKRWETLTDAQAADLARRVFANDQNRLALRRKFFQQIAKQVNPTTAARVLQLEHQMDLAVDTQIAAELPLIK